MVTALLAACGGSTSEAPTPAAVQADVGALQLALSDDLSLLAIEEAERLVDDDRPVLAASRFRDGALPAARRHVERVRGLELGTADGRRLQADAVSALEARVMALQRYAAALDRGIVEDYELAEALRVQREAEAAIETLFERLEVLRPTQAAPPANTEATERHTPEP